MLESVTLLAVDVECVGWRKPSAVTHNRRMACPSSRLAALVALAIVGSACATDDDPAVTTAATIGGDTGSATMTGTMTDPTMTSATDPDADDDVADDDAPADSSSTGTPTDTPAECMDGEADCPCIEGECMRGLMCIADVCEAPAHCDPDPGEPNDVAAEATMLEPISDDDLEGTMLSGVLENPGDIDWFVYRGSDVVGETVDPARLLVTEGGSLEMCKYLDCIEGTELITCPPGSMPAESAGHPGCCGAGSIVFDPEGFECEGGAFETGADVYIRLLNATAQCVTYEVSYHY